MRSGGCGTRRAGKEVDAEALEAHVRARQWVREAITIFEVAMLEPLQYSLTLPQLAGYSPVGFSSVQLFFLKNPTFCKKHVERISRLSL
jgi:hypothetical protein